MMRLVIADPPYLGRAATWYGGKGRGTTSTPGRARGRAPEAAEYHPDAAHWDTPQAHIDLMASLDATADGWAMAASGKTLPEIAHGIPATARIAIWQVTNAIPDGARVRSVWEAVIVRVPDGRRAASAGMTVRDVLTCSAPRQGFVGSKPQEWTGWVLDMLGYRPDEDRVEDVFPGSGAVAIAAGRLL